MLSGTTFDALFFLLIDDFCFYPELSLFGEDLSGV